MNSTDHELLTMARRLARHIERDIEAGVEAGRDMSDDIALLAEWEALEARICCPPRSPVAG
jgi:hypothetical protein